MQKKIYNNILRLSQGGVEMVFKKAKLFWKNENDREIINSVFYDDSVEYYTFLRKCKSEGYRQVIVTTEIMIQLLRVSVIKKGFVIYKIEFAEEDCELENEIKNIKDYTYLILTSKNAVDIFFDKLDEMDLDSRVLANLKVCAIGSATAKEIKNRGIKADIVPEKFVAEYLFEELKDILKDSDKVLIPRAKNARDFLVDKISEICEVKEVHIYETVLDDSKKDEVLDILNSGEADYITFASSSTVTNFVDIIGKENIDKLNELKVISIGPITTQTAKSLNINVYNEAEVSTIDGMIDSIMNDK